jgi:hypothetical protein
MGLWNCCYQRGTLLQAQDLAEELLHLAEELNSPALLLAAYRALGTILTIRGDFTAARRPLERGLALYDSDQHRPTGMVTMGLGVVHRMTPPSRLGRIVLVVVDSRAVPLCQRANTV